MILDQLFAIPLDGKHFIIYAPLKRICFIANQAMVNAIVDYCKGRNVIDCRSEHFQLLESLDFFHPEELPRIKQSADWVSAYDTVVLFLTNQCNLRCSYCYASSGDYPIKKMSWQIAKTAINHVTESIVSNGGHEIILGFHGGGEPSLNWPVLKRSVEYTEHLARENGLEYTISGAFNGYWDEKTIEFIVTRFTEASLSFDGLPAVQNHQRPTISGGESGNRVERSLRTLDRADFPYGIRMTVTDFSVETLPDSVRYICENFKPGRIQAEPVFLSGRAVENHAAVSDPNLFVDRFLESFEIAHEYGIELFYSGARLEALSNRFCLAAVRALVVTTDGDVTTCFEIFSRDHPASERFIVGYYGEDSLFKIDSEKLRRQAVCTVDNLDRCRDCFCKWSCAGDCVTRRIVDSFNTPSMPTDRCRVNREITKYLMLDKIRRSGGFCWAG